MRSFIGTIITEDLHSCILSTLTYVFLTLKFAGIDFYQCTFFQRVSEHKLPQNKPFTEEATFSEQQRLYWNESSYFFEAANFSQKEFFQKT